MTVGRPTIGIALLLVAALALTLGACGTSKEQQAKSTVCSARTDIDTQINRLRGLTLATVSVDKVRTSVQAIESDLTRIKGATADLADTLRPQVQSANQAFANELKTIVAGVTSTGSLTSVKTQLTAALQQLGAAYRSTLAQIRC
jgi:hypothetical protein